MASCTEMGDFTPRFVLLELFYRELGTHIGAVFWIEMMTKRWIFRTPSISSGFGRMRLSGLLLMLNQMTRNHA